MHLIQSAARTLYPPVDYINYPTHQLSVHLYDVNTVLVDTEAQLDRLTTEWEQTKLHIDLTTQNTNREDYHFDIAGFKHQNIFFITDDSQVPLKQVRDLKNNAIC